MAEASKTPLGSDSRMPFRILTACLCVLSFAGVAGAEIFTVNSAGDEGNANPGNGSGEAFPGTGIVTLRSAIEEANAIPGSHIIEINRAVVNRISPTTPLPPIANESVFIEGNGAVLDGSQVAGTFQQVDGLVIQDRNASVRRLTIVRFRGNGIRITGANASNVLVQGCHIGDTVGGGNEGAGILIENGAQGAFIGAISTTSAQNTIAGNGGPGIAVDGEDSQSNIFSRNRIFENGAGPQGIVFSNGAQDGVAPPVIAGLNPVRGQAAPNGLVELFMDRGRQGEVFVASTLADGQGNFELDLDLQDFIKKPILTVDQSIPLTRRLTATTTDTNGNTSAFSNAEPIQGAAPAGAGRVGYSRVPVGNRSFQPDGTLQVFITVDRINLPTADSLEIVEVIPEGWTFATSTATGTSGSPGPGSGPILRWEFNNFTQNDLNFSYTLNIPPDAEGTVAIEGQATLNIEPLFAVSSPWVSTGLVETGFANIVGKVAEFGTNQPIPCATVEFEALDESGRRYFAVVDNNGLFEFRMLPFGSYNKRLLAPGFGSFTPVEFEVNSARFVLLINPAPSTRPALVRGIVTDADTGQPLAGVFVVARIGQTVVGSTYTCATGNYAILRPLVNTKQESTTVDLEFSADNYDPASQTVQAPPDAAGEADQALEKGLLFPSALVGQITSADTGAAPTGGQVVLQGPINTLTPVEGDGTYVFDAILDGNYSVQASAPGFEPSSKFKQVGSNAIETLNFVLTPTPPQENPFDINGDGAVNAVDVQLVINAALGLSIAPFNADVNGDGTVNAVDVQLVINAALGLI
jgi:hypothetical protein